MSREAPVPRVREVHPGIFVVHLPLPMRPTIVNVYLIRGGGDWALVDTGVNSPESLAALREAMETVGCAPRALRAVLCTHHHPDHFGAAQPIAEMSGAAVHLHPVEYESAQLFASPGAARTLINDFFARHGFPIARDVRVPTPREIWASMYAPVAPDVPIADGDVLRVGDRALTVVCTPGHTRAHCVFHLAEERVLIAGDHLLPKITPHVGLYPNGVPNPLGDFLASQRKIAPLAVDLVLPAHGGTFADHRHRIAQIEQHHAARLGEMLDCVRRQPHVAYDVARLAFGFDADSQFGVQALATFETLAHLEYLRARGDVRSEEIDGRMFYVGCERR